MNDFIVAAAQSIALPGDLTRSIDDHVRLAAHAAALGASLVVFPELSLTGYDRTLRRADALGPDDPRLAPVQAVADAHSISVIVGAPIASETGLHIGALCFAPLRSPSVYTKQYLHAGEETAFAVGAGGTPVSIADRTVCLAICAEITHPQHAQCAADRGADVYAASCFITPTGYAYDTHLLQNHASCHRMTVVMANFGNGCGGWASAGGSAIWSSSGVVLARAPDQGEAVIAATVS